MIAELVAAALADDERAALDAEICRRYHHRGICTNETGFMSTVRIALDVFAEHLAAPIVDEPDAHYCPTCGATGRSGQDGCASSSGRDHPTRKVWMRAYSAGAVAARRAILAAQPTAAIAAVREIHHPVPYAEACEAEEWAPKHYGQAVDAHWIRCGLRGQHEEHGDPGNTGLTWPLSDADRAEQERLPKVCDECDQAYPCPTIQALDGRAAG